MTPGTLLVRFPAHSDDYFKSPYHPLPCPCCLYVMPDAGCCADDQELIYQASSYHVVAGDDVLNL